MEYYGITIPTVSNSTHLPFINAKNQIGWRYFVQGRVDKNILPLISLEYKQKIPTKYFADKQWVKQVIQIMMDEHEIAWK